MSRFDTMTVLLLTEDIKLLCAEINRLYAAIARENGLVADTYVFMHDQAVEKLRQKLGDLQSVIHNELLLRAPR